MSAPEGGENARERRLTLAGCGCVNGPGPEQEGVFWRYFRAADYHAH
jgi:hypothetical protein